MLRFENDERFAKIAAELANNPFAQADALRKLADELDRGKPLPLAIATPLIARLAEATLVGRLIERVLDENHDILAALAKND